MRIIEFVMACGALLTTVPTSAAADTLVVLMPVRATDADRRAVDHVEARLSGDLRVQTATTPTNQNVLASTEGMGPRPDFVIGIDATAGLIAVRRLRDGTTLVREMAPDVFRASPYSAAMAALELIDLAKGHPRRVAAPEDVPATVTAPVVPTSTGTPSLALRIEVAGATAWSAGGDVWLVRPSFSLGAELDFSGVALRIDVRGRLLGRQTAEVGPRTVDYGRHDFDVGAGIVLTGKPFRMGASVRIGASDVRTELFDGATLTARDRRFVPWLGLAITVERSIGAGFGLVGTLDLAWVPQPPRFVVEQTSVLDERGFRLGLAIGVTWSSS